MSEPTPQSNAPAQQPADGSALWALLVGGAILAIAALLIFWPGGDSASQAGRQGASGQQASHSGSNAARSGAGGGLGVSARDIDPAKYPSGGRVNPSLFPEGKTGLSLAPPRPPKPEPTSFNSASEEIAYYEKKLDEARVNLERRTLFWERMKKNIENAPSPQGREAAEQRGKIVEQNYNDAKKAHEDLVKKVADLKAKQQKSGNP